MESFSDTALLYLSVLFGPFVQEDAAVLYAASLSVTNMGKTPQLYIIIIIGLFFSDIWKYWIGWAALRNARAREFTEKKQVILLKDKVEQFTVSTLMTARFVPLTRIPVYVACGLFGINYGKYCLFIAISATLYVTIIFGIFHVLGSVLGEKLLWVLPVAAILGLSLFFGYHMFKARRPGTKDRPE